MTIDREMFNSLIASRSSGDSRVLVLLWLHFIFTAGGDIVVQFMLIYQLMMDVYDFIFWQLHNCEGHLLVCKCFMESYALYWRPVLQMFCPHTPWMENRGEIVDKCCEVKFAIVFFYSLDFFFITRMTCHIYVYMYTLMGAMGTVLEHLSSLKCWWSSDQ